MKTKNLTKKLGQNTAEYMLLLLLIGGGSILAFKTFGKGIINRFASVTSIISGKGAVTATVTTVNENVDFTSFEGNGANGAAAGGTTPPTTP